MLIIVEIVFHTSEVLFLRRPFPVVDGVHPLRTSRFSWNSPNHDLALIEKHIKATLFNRTIKMIELHFRNLFIFFISKYDITPVRPDTGDWSGTIKQSMGNGEQILGSAAQYFGVRS